MKKFVATVAVLSLVAAANATITASLSAGTPVALTPGNAVYYDISVTLSGGDDWTAAGIDATATTSFYQDAVNDGNPPNPAFFGFVPDSEFTSFYSSPGTWPNTTYNASAVGVAFTADAGPILNTDWFDTLATGDGTFTIARVTIMDDVLGNAGGAVIDLDVAAVNSGGTLFHYNWVIPEPSTLVLLGLGGLAGLIRRR